MLKDQAARDIISTEAELNLMVEAGAGSGKTEEMAKRIIALVNSGYRDIGEIVAITFTRKAANELRERVRKMLIKEYDKSSNERLKKALDSIHECFIGTIHSFCVKILHERPIEANVDPDFEQIDDAKDAFTRQKIWESYVLEAGDDENKILHLMDLFGVRESVAKNFLKYVCDNQDVEFNLPDEKVLSLDVFMDKVKDVLNELWNNIRANYDDIPVDVINGVIDSDGLQKSMIEFHYKTRGEKLENLTDSELIKLLTIFSTKSSVKVTQNRWGSTKEEKANAKELGSLFLEIQESKIFPLISEINSFVYNFVLIPFVDKAKMLYIKHKNTVAELNYQDLLLKSADMLMEYPDVRRYFQSRYKTILIDEFQDTDPIQVRMAMYLVGKELDEKRWNMITPNDGSLFVVGDPKQSIYGFRRADFTMYKRFKEHIEKTGGKVIELYTNFRAVNELGCWYNKAFVNLFSSEEQASFSEMDAVMPVLDNTLAGVAYYRIEESKVAQITEKEPEVLIRIIRHLVGKKEITARSALGNIKRPVQYKDIMILAMKKRYLETIGSSIAESGIPVKITGSDITKRTSAFISFRDLIRMLAYPEENAYIHNVMKGDFFSISDKEIYRFYSLGGAFNLYFDFKLFFEENPLSDEDNKTFLKIESCFGKLKQFLDYIKNLSSAAATERIIEELGIIKMHLTSDERITGLGSFVSLIEKIRLKKITDIWGLDLFLNELSLMIESGFEEDIEIEGKDSDAVRIMNTHKAKGLEAPIVILCAPCGGKVMEPTFYTECVVDKAFCEQYYGYLRLDKNPDFGFARQYFEPAGWSVIEEKAKAKESLERDRLLYVAATRAKNYLIIAGSAAKDNPWDKLIGWLPNGTANILDEVYNDIEESEIVSAENGKATFIEIDADKAIIDIKLSRDEAFKQNHPTFSVYTPSKEIRKVKNSDGETTVSYEMEKTILENTMEVIINGEESVVKSDRLEIGTIVHKLLETLIKDESVLSDVIDAIITAEKDDYITKEFLESVVTEFKNRKLYERVRKSDAVHTEVPFSYKVAADGIYAGNKFSRDTYVNGIIDLVFKESNIWTIIDYKTYEENESSHELRKMYEPQLNAYKDIWEKITGEYVGETEIFFIRKRVVAQKSL